MDCPIEADMIANHLNQRRIFCVSISSQTATPEQRQLAGFPGLSSDKIRLAGDRQAQSAKSAPHPAYRVIGATFHSSHGDCRRKISPVATVNSRLLLPCRASAKTSYIVPEYRGNRTNDIQSINQSINYAFISYQSQS